MKVIYNENGEIAINLMALLECIDGEQKIHLAESLACDGEIIKYVAQQIIDKWTENGSYGYTSCTAGHNPMLGLDWAWREVAKASDEVAKREIEKLEKALKIMTERFFDLANERHQVDQY